MKWFKHDTSANRDAKIEKLLLKYGADGYALYWLCLELIADRIDKEHLTFELEHDAETLGARLRIDTLRVEEIMKYCIMLELFENEGPRITCLKLANRIENSTIKSPEFRKVQEKIRENPGKSGKIPDDPGKSQMIRENPGKSGKIPENPGQIRLDEIRLEEKREREYSRALKISENPEKPRSEKESAEPVIPLGPPALVEAQANATTRIETARENWNRLGLLPEARFTALTMAPDDRANCLRTVQAYADPEIFKAIENYHGIGKSSEHRIPAPYRSFSGFMRGGVEKFVDSADPWAQYRDKDNSGVYGGFDSPDEIEKQLEEYRARKARGEA